VNDVGERSVALRRVDESDLDALFGQMSDPESGMMAAFTPDDPDDRQRFDAHMARVLKSPEVTHRAVLEKAGFRVIDTEVFFASARGAEIEETILRLG
jgi:hypothetical protein